MYKYVRERAVVRLFKPDSDGESPGIFEIWPSSRSSQLGSRLSLHLANSAFDGHSGISAAMRGTSLCSFSSTGSCQLYKMYDVIT